MDFIDFWYPLGSLFSIILCDFPILFGTWISYRVFNGFGTCFRILFWWFFAPFCTYDTETLILWKYAPHAGGITIFKVSTPHIFMFFWVSLLIFRGRFILWKYAPHAGGSTVLEVLAPQEKHVFSWFSSPFSTPVFELIFDEFRHRFWLHFGTFLA